MKKVALGMVLGLGALVASGQEPPSAEPVATPVAGAEEQAVDGTQAIGTPGCWPPSISTKCGR